MAGDSQVVLELFCESPPAIMRASGELACGLGLSTVETGLCRSQPVVLAQHSVAGVKVQNRLILGEVVS